MSQERNPYLRIKRTFDRCNQFDTHEILKKEIYKQAAEGNNNIGSKISVDADTDSSVTTTTAKQVGFQDFEFHFDSINRDLTSNILGGEMAWSITQLNNTQDIENIIEMKVGRFFFPRVQTQANQPDFFYYRRVYMLVLNLPSTQAILAANYNQYHFEFEVININSVAVELVPTKDSFYFQKPVTQLTDFQVRFTVPHNFKRIPIPKDTINVISVAGTNPAQLSITGGDLTTLIGAQGPVMVAIYVSGFMSSDNTANTAINDLGGVYVTNIISATDFLISGVDFTNVAGGITATVIIPKNRIAFPFRFTTLTNQPANFITISHE